MKTASTPRLLTRAAALGMLFSVACTGATKESATTSAPAVIVVAHDSREDATVDVRFMSPLHARWSSATLGAPQRELGIVVENHGSVPLDVSDLRVHLETLRERSSFRCADEVGPSPHAREPASLAPGASFVFERMLDCDLPLLGSYIVDLSVSFGRDAWAKRRSVRSFTMSVFATPDIAPRKIAAVPGLWGALGAQSYVRGAASDGPDRVVVALVNGGDVPLELPHFRLALRVYRVGSDVACEDAPVDLDGPPVLAAGASFHQPIALSCIGLGQPGMYDVVGRLEIGEDSEPWRVEIGRLRIEVSTQPPPPRPLVPGLVSP